MSGLSAGGEQSQAFRIVAFSQNTEVLGDPEVLHQSSDVSGQLRLDNS